MINAFQAAILKGLQVGKHVYGGTVSPEVIRKRRAKNKVARRQRKINGRG